jgi:hypothetical protein
MKGKTLLTVSMFSLVILYFVNIGAFVVSDVAEHLDVGRVGTSLSWIEAANFTGFLVHIILLFLIIEVVFSASYKRKSAQWKKIIVVIFDFIILFLAVVQLSMLASIPGEKIFWATGSYMYTYETTTTVYILYFGVLLLITGAFLMTVENLNLSNHIKWLQFTKSTKEK